MPNLRYLLPSELDDLVRLLRPDRPQSVEIHHLQGHDPAVISLAQRLAVPWVVYIHDYMWFCPRVTLIGPRRRYCGEPSDVAICEACIADAGRNDEQDGSVSVMRQRSATILAGASVVHAPSADAAARISRHFPNILPKPTPLDDDAALPAEPSGPGSAAGRRRIGVVGAIGLEKGYDVLLACARDAERRRLPLEFVVIGHSIDDARLLATGRVFVTGPYRESEVLDEIHREAPDLVFLPSIWPETWCFVVGEAWRAGRLVVAFDIGAPAERIRRTGRGWLLPLDTEPNAVNDFLLHATNSAAADVKATRSRA
jgi:glycosyltransferase involved in cell wall biosynthesis